MEQTCTWTSGDAKWNNSRLISGFYWQNLETRNGVGGGGILQTFNDILRQHYSCTCSDKIEGANPVALYICTLGDMKLSDRILEQR
jgi:hypothetical protein